MSKATSIDPHAAARALGAKGGKARAKSLSKERRREIASAAGRARHGLKPKRPKKKAAKKPPPAAPIPSNS